MLIRKEITLPPLGRGFHIIDDYLRKEIDFPKEGLCHIFIRHTSAALALNEGADPAVLTDLEKIFNLLVPENQSFYTHTEEGPDDMPSHAKAILCGCTLTLPVADGKLDLGQWQSI